MKKAKRNISPGQRVELIDTLKERFEKNANRHKGIEWVKVLAWLDSKPEKLWALVKAELAVWEAWKSHDAKTLEELTANDLSFVDIFGTVTTNKPDTIKLWAENRCDVKSVSITDGVATPISPTVSILTFKGNAEGTCYGQKIGGPIFGTSVYVKSGETWKSAFTLNSPD